MMIKIKNKKLVLMAIILCLSFGWNNSLFSMEEREAGASEQQEEETAQKKDKGKEKEEEEAGNHSSSQKDLENKKFENRSFCFFIGVPDDKKLEELSENDRAKLLKVENVPWGIVTQMPLLQQWIVDTFKEQDNVKKFIEISIDEMFPDPQAVEENHKIFSTIVALLERGPAKVAIKLSHYQIREYIPLLKCMHKLNVQIIFESCLEACVKKIESAEEISDELFIELENGLGTDLFHMLCFKINGMPLEISTANFNYPYDIDHIAFGKNSETLWVAGAERIYFMDFNEGECLQTIDFPDHDYRMVQFVRSLNLIHKEKGESHKREIPGREKNLISERINRKLVIAAAKKMYFYDLKGSKWSSTKIEDNIFCADLSPNQKWLAEGGLGTVCVRRIDQKGDCSGDPMILVIEGKTNNNFCKIKRVAFNRDGTLLVAGDSRGNVYVWNDAQFDQSKESSNVEDKPLLTFLLKNINDGDKMMLHFDFHPTKPVLGIKMETASEEIIYTLNLEKNNSLREIFHSEVHKYRTRFSNIYATNPWNPLTHRLRFGPDGTLYCVLSENKNDGNSLYCFSNVDEEEPTSSKVINDQDVRAFDVSDGNALAVALNGKRLKCYLVRNAVTAQLSNAAEVTLFHQLERDRKKNDPTVLCKHKPLFNVYKSKENLFRYFHPIIGCSPMCYVKKFKKPLVIAGAVGAVALAGYLAYKKWIRA